MYAIRSYYGQQYPPQRDDRHARCAGERREERADEYGDHGDGAGHPSHHRPEEPDEAFGGVARGKDVPREGEQGDRGQRRGGHSYNFV